MRWKPMRTCSSMTTTRRNRLLKSRLFRSSNPLLAFLNSEKLLDLAHAISIQLHALQSSSVWWVHSLFGGYLVSDKKEKESEKITARTKNSHLFLKTITALQKTFLRARSINKHNEWNWVLYSVTHFVADWQKMKENKKAKHLCFDVSQLLTHLESGDESSQSSDQTERDGQTSSRTLNSAFSSSASSSLAS